MVENHYDFVNTKDLKSSKDLEYIFKELGMNDSFYVKMNGEIVYLPTPNLNALFLLRHNLLHFVSTSMSLRQVLDWGFFVQSHGHEVDWDWLLNILDNFNMKTFFDCLNGVCVDDLGFSRDFFPYVQYDDVIKEKVLCDILHPKFATSEPRSFVRRLFYKYRRWEGNAWKQKLCYKENRFRAFWQGLWAHLLKPSSL